MKKISEKESAAAFLELIGIVGKLREPDGCPWDREQTPLTLRNHLLEESYEAVEAIDDKDPDHVREELGDVLLLVAMIARMYQEDDCFTITDVLKEVSAKLVRRHPHVFGDIKVKDADEVLRNWNKIKEDIEGRAVKDSVLDGVVSSLPPLERAYKLQKKASKHGFDWNDINGPREKIAEELKEIEMELEQNNDPGKLEEEVGDFLFSAVNFSRHLGVDPSLALRRTNQKFEKRFHYIEEKFRNDGIEMSAENMREMDRLWDESKELS